MSLPLRNQQDQAFGAWRVLVVENDEVEAQLLALRLRRHGHEVESVATGDAALRRWDQADLVLLDLELPDLDGLEVCRGIRETSMLPVIAVTSRDSELDCVLALQVGADDYMVKPYGFRELMARIEAVMRRSGPRRVLPVTIAYGELRIDAGTREVFLAGQRIELTRKEFDLLRLLAANPGVVLERERLLEEVWGQTWSRRTLDTHVSSLRAKLGASDWVITVRGVGFRLGPAERGAARDGRSDDERDGDRDDDRRSA
ncbi:response regulator transcription factor [Streptacidiphilus jiangxiensis]|uniref:Sensory transduction protein RegX3 n=1 Tax=Streptacidiphilus jiangxiensis TaxID=235985 RepID=A0A1H7KH07_STRJI|nr:response regulator transcription factor [Streptacidiphilus jiangxiensis]SEK86141.1 DNA-binding response regulator, OmpR family, contains REC and winged-helix (wHTH) domain [Streptacidiphilus jiangxiensis]